MSNNQFSLGSNSISMVTIPSVSSSSSLASVSIKFIYNVSSRHLIDLYMNNKKKNQNILLNPNAQTNQPNANLQTVNRPLYYLIAPQTTTNSLAYSSTLASALTLPQNTFMAYPQQNQNLLYITPQQQQQQQQFQSTVYSTPLIINGGIGGYQTMSYINPNQWLAGQTNPTVNTNSNLATSIGNTSTGQITSTFSSIDYPLFNTSATSGNTSMASNLIVPNQPLLNEQQDNLESESSEHNDDDDDDVDIDVVGVDDEENSTMATSEQPINRSISMSTATSSSLENATNLEQQRQQPTSTSVLTASKSIETTITQNVSESQPQQQQRMNLRARDKYTQTYTRYRVHKMYKAKEDTLVARINALEAENQSLKTKLAKTNEQLKQCGPSDPSLDD